MDQNNLARKPIAKWGFGMAPLSDTMRERYDNAVRTLIFFLRAEIIASEVELNSVSELKGMFNRSLRKDQWDWFTVYEQLGHPPRGEMHYFVSKLINLRISLGDRNVESVERTRNDLFSSTILHYLDCWWNVEAQQKDVQHGWLYILSTRDQPNLLKIGMTTRSVPERVKEINSATGVLYPFSARTVYKVKDARSAERRIFQLLSDYRVRRDREFFEIPFSEAANIIEDALFSEGALKRKQGTVKWFSAEKGYGFISYDEEMEIFVHMTEISDERIKFLEQGQQVEFEIKNTNRGTMATRVIVVDQ
jgi:cold shock CspA family protein